MEGLAHFISLFYYMFVRLNRGVARNIREK